MEPRYTLVRRKDDINGADHLIFPATSIDSSRSAAQICSRARSKAIPDFTIRQQTNYNRPGRAAMPGTMDKTPGKPEPRLAAITVAALFVAFWGTPANPQTPAVKATPDEQQATRAAKQAAWAKAAETRSEFTVRELRLGMTLPELESKLGTEIVEISPPRKPDWKAPAYGAYTETLRLSDGSKFTVTFSSPVTGSIGGLVMYEQTLRDGPLPEKLMADLTGRYGSPDERGASGWWLTWHLRSRAPVPDHLGSFLKIHFRTGQDGKVDYFRAVLNDYKFMMMDEQKAAEARREADRREADRRKSDAVKF
jgi:hypothetical protein